MVREPVQHRRRHLRIAEDRRPLAEAQVRRDHDAGALVELGQQMEQQRTTRSAERHVAQLVQDHQVGVHQLVRDLSDLFSIPASSAAVSLTMASEWIAGEALCD
jgi:hypothetical protein